MKILVINGSPKGDYSTTLYSCLYIEKNNPQHEFSFFNVGRDIKKLKRIFLKQRKKS